MAHSVQLLGKDILTTHTIYWWHAFCLGLTPPKQIFAHGWWTVEGQKMSKSTGNVVDPNLLLDCYGSDTLRFFVLREIPFGGDGDFGHQKLLTRYNTDLANDLGNLLHRAISMGTKWLGGSIPELDEAQEIDIALQNKVEEKSKQYVALLENLQFYQAIESLFEMIREGNKYIDTEQPWRLNKEGNTVRLGWCYEAVWRFVASLLGCSRQSYQIRARNYWSNAFINSDKPSFLGRSNCWFSIGNEKASLSSTKNSRKNSNPSC